MSGSGRYFYTPERVKELSGELRLILLEAGRSLPDWYLRLTPEQMRAAANGIGAEWMGAVSREALTAWYSDFAPIAFFHDLAGTYDNDGTRLGFERWNAECFGNLCPVVWRRYAWWRPKRYLLRYQARHLCFALSTFGFKAWEDAFRKKQAEGGDCDVVNDAI